MPIVVPDEGEFQQGLYGIHILNVYFNSFAQLVAKNSASIPKTIEYTRCFALHKNIQFKWLADAVGQNPSSIKAHNFMPIVGVIMSSKGDFYFTSESVGDGHPDKVADQISDAVVDRFLREDPISRVAAETIVTTNWVAICGEARGSDSIDAKEIEHLTRETIRDIGYEQDGFHWAKAEVVVRLHKQSSDIAQGVDEAADKAEGAGDQGLMFGYAVNETPELMPAPIMFAHTILRKISEDRRAGKLPLLGPDAKSQVTLQYIDGKPVHADRIVVSIQHSEKIDQAVVRELVRPYVKSALPEGWLPEEKHFYVNPTGRFVIGGPDGDAGLTGRKIIVDTYGGSSPHGGGAFSGKDPTKVDRSAAYAARYLAKNVVASGIADECLIQLSYAIGVSEPLSFYINTQGRNKVDVAKLPSLMRELMDLSPRGIREHLQLNRPIYQKTAAFGHFGRNPESDGSFSWERTDLVPAIRSAFNLKL